MGSPDDSISVHGLHQNEGHPFNPSLFSAANSNIPQIRSFYNSINDIFRPDLRAPWISYYIPQDIYDEFSKVGDPSWILFFELQQTVLAQTNQQGSGSTQLDGIPIVGTNQQEVKTWNKLQEEENRGRFQQEAEQQQHEIVVKKMLDQEELRKKKTHEAHAPLMHKDEQQTQQQQIENDVLQAYTNDESGEKFIVENKEPTIMIFFGSLIQGILVPCWKKECHSSTITVKRVWEPGIPHANKEATEIVDLPSTKGKTGLLQVAELGDPFDKNAAFVDMFNKEAYRDPFCVILEDRGASLARRMLLKFHILCFQLTVGTLFFWNLLNFFWVKSCYKRRNRGCLLCGADLWDPNGSPFVLSKLAAGLLFSWLLFPTSLYIAQYQSWKENAFFLFGLIGILD